jgi:hypothetical protein
VRKSPQAPGRRVDVHAHFFNATDEPVEGYLAGPVAHKKGGALGYLIRLLAPIAQALSVIAPTAAQELKRLDELAERVNGLDANAREQFVAQEMRSIRGTVSRQFYEAARGTAFEREYNRLIDQRRRAQSPEMRMLELDEHLHEDTLARAIELGGRPREVSRGMRSLLSRDAYPEGVVAFVGFMLSPRWTNLATYQEAYSTAEGAFGIDQVYGSLIDMAHWLEPEPVSGQDEQIELHRRLSELSNGYMRPLAGYNPWRDVLEGNGKSAERAINAVLNLGFAGIKLYPPNGFRPYGNATLRPRLPRLPGRPSAADLDAALASFWRSCAQHEIPVMAHGGSSMGSTDAFNALAGPAGWNAALELTAKSGSPARGSVAHFGGAVSKNRWTQEFAEVMTTPRGAGFYGDIAYWDELQCLDPKSASCRASLKRLSTALAVTNVSQRVMYGSDWHMLSQEPDWWAYPADIAESTKSLIDQSDLFAANADRFFARKAPV